MPFNRAPLSDIIDRTRADIESRLPGSDARLRRRVLSVLADALAGAVNGLYGYLDFLSRQPLADQAEAEYLDRHASLFGLTRKAATAATGTVTATGIDGSIIPAGTLLTSLHRSLEALVIATRPPRSTWLTRYRESTAF
jgi:uncharacterized phage protein gp47/JayE